MKIHKAKHKCPICDSPRVEIRHDRTVRYRYLKKDHVLEGQEHTVCLDCELSFYQPGQIDRNNERLAAFEKSIVKGISPHEILTLREKYLITQEQAARIFHCGKTAFSKWERGEVAPTGMAALLLESALESPDFMKSLADKAGEAVDIQVTAPKPEENEAVFYSIGEVLVARTVEEHAMPLMEFRKHKIFTRQPIHYQAVSGFGIVNVKDGNKKGKPYPKGTTPAWMIPGLR